MWAFQVRGFTMSNVGTGLIIVLCIDAMLFFAQYAAVDLAARQGTTAQVFFNCNGTIMNNYGDCMAGASAGRAALQQNVSAGLPSAQTGVSSSQGGYVFTDVFSTIGNWIKGGVNAVKSVGSALVGVVTAPTDLLDSMGLPPAFTFMVGIIWFGINIFYVAAFMFGKPYA